jgi:hypothetical protein
MKLAEIDKGWIAGIIDGEGSICLTRQKANEHRSPELEVTSTTKEMLEKLQGLCGGSISIQKVYQAHYKPSWHWNIKGNKVLELLSEIREYLLVPEKKYRADLLVNEYKLVTPRNGRYSAEKLQQKLDFEKRFFEFNLKNSKQ